MQEAVQDDALIIWGLALDPQQKDMGITVILAESEGETAAHETAKKELTTGKDTQMMQEETMDTPNTPIRFLDLIGLDWTTNN